MDDTEWYRCDSGLNGKGCMRGWRERGTEKGREKLLKIREILTLISPTRLNSDSTS